MTRHLHATYVTNVAIAANNRGETEGNITTLQKIMWNNDIHTTVSAEAIRFALRYYWQQQYQLTNDESYAVNRFYDGDKFLWQDESFSDGGERFVDDDVLGFMDAKAPKVENGEASASAEVEETENNGKQRSAKKPTKGSAKVRRGALEVTRAISLLPFLGEVSFNSKAGEKSNTSLYGTEMHATAYQYSVTLTPSQLKRMDRTSLVVDALSSLHNVGGNQARFLFDFSPQLAVYRITHDPAPRILFVAEAEGNSCSLRPLINRLKAGDITADELVIGGRVAGGEVEELTDLGVFHIYQGVRQAAEIVKATNWV